MKGGSYDTANWKVCDKEFYLNEIQVAIKDGPPSYTKDNLEDNQEEYSSLTHEYWCDLLSTIKVKDNRKGKRTKSRRSLLIERPLYLTAMDPLGS